MAWSKKAALKLLAQRNSEAKCKMVTPAELRRLALEEQGGRALTTKRIASEVFGFLSAVVGEFDANTFVATCVEVEKLGCVTIKRDHPDLEKVRFVQVIDAARFPDDESLWKLSDCQIIHMACLIGEEIAACIIERPEDPAAV